MSAAQSTAVFVNARIITLDLAQPVAEAMAVQDGRIIALGTKSEILSLAGSGASIADLEGQVVVPGFHDSHMHLLSWGLTMDGVQLEQARSAEELVELGRAYVRSNPDRQWIIGRGFNDETFSLRQLPTREDLDRVSVQQPVVFTRVCGHVCVVNSKALELAGIGEDTPEPPGGSLDRDREGQPTGVLRENAMDLVMQLIPSPSVADWKRILRRACAQAAALGLTTIQSNDLNGASSLNKRLQAYRELDEAGELPIRIILQAGMPRLEDLQAYLEIVKAFQPSPMLTLGALKLFADGSLGGRTAALTSSYADAPDTDGMLIYSQEELDQLVLAAARSGLQVAVHAIGDRALDLVLNSYDHAKRLYPAWQRRPRVIHAQITRFDQLERLARLGAVADIQPIFVPTDMHFAERRVGTALAEYSYAWKTMLDLGIAAAGVRLPCRTLQSPLGHARRGNQAGSQRLPVRRLAPRAAPRRLHSAAPVYHRFRLCRRGRKDQRRPQPRKAGRLRRSAAGSHRNRPPGPPGPEGYRHLCRRKESLPIKKPGISPGYPT